MPALTLDRLEKRYPGGHTAASSVSLSVKDGEFISLLGPSGCGKTTVLRMVAGLIQPTSGRILIDERDVTQLPANKRRIGLVFQSYALFPHMSVFENVAFGLRRQGVEGGELKRRVEQALASVRLSAYGERLPRQLSGGQQQRVAVARSIAPRPSILLFDEPLSNLDASLRDEMQIELKRLQREVGITTLFVTHDQGEAMSMSDRVCVLAHGVVQQFATPEEIYHRPATGFVASFIGRPNRLRGRLVRPAGAPPAVQIDGGGPTLALAAVDGIADGAAVDVVVRQEDIRFLGAGEDAGFALDGRVALRSFVGSRVQYVLGFGGIELIAEAPTNGGFAGLGAGAPVRVAIEPQHVYVNAAQGPGAA
ncbi:Fe3+/spermidine/putrescine ABC transporter ATP-binding protein [Variovorax sp. WS11]|uniref:ABC transporter ATP-binding protein n=1 Tax=Variovorax sp. WS11 TaxID=1105204 RepID=UPI000D0DB72B|nr:ABC transporter ATP-binding protein [Variovorax sp. WS11]NDZ17623.1 ABC transporter ATP-binding protein [Variovorax sp. WS11]PSL79156.1 Fe3+/spermidine/putrescine ABC transporter ATP-binding protein [Variovorax sp. WS11]